jgi:hypothetical protein
MAGSRGRHPSCAIPTGRAEADPAL